MSLSKPIQNRRAPLPFFPSFPTFSFSLHLHLLLSGSWGMGLTGEQRESSSVTPSWFVPSCLALSHPLGRLSRRLQKTVSLMGPICAYSETSYWELLHCLVLDLGNLLWLPSSASSPSAHPQPLLSVTPASGGWDPRRWLQPR